MAKRPWRRSCGESPSLQLRGVGGYEGALAHDRSEASLAAVRSWLAQLVDLLRSGAYQVHDDGFYASISPLAGELRSAMHGWARVVSRPEPGLALLDGGKRDFPFDEGLPVALDIPGSTATALNDQHTFLRLPEGTDLAVGDVVRLGLSHPCTALDRWTLIPVIASLEDRTVVDVIRTWF